MTNGSSLKIPRGINFLCSGCGNCCLEWPVPATREDFQRISKRAGDFNSRPEALFRVLKTSDEKLARFTHSLEKREDGKCEFLSDENRCLLHERYGPEEKPAMCRLFPYSFTRTPSGTYVSVSMASTAALLNQGEPLDTQHQHLEDVHRIFDEVFPNLTLDWSSIQVIDGIDLDWERYLSLEETILTVLDPTGKQPDRVDRTLFEAAGGFRELVPGSVNLDNMAGFPARPKLVDQMLLRELVALYFPEDTYRSSGYDLDARDLISRMISGGEGGDIVWHGRPVSVGRLLSVKLGNLPHIIEDLLRRFAYIRIFSKLYFGPGYNYLSAVAGLHHLAFVVSMARICLKLDISVGRLEKEELNEQKGLFTLAEHIRTLERRLTVSSFSSETVAMLEVLLASPGRIKRMMSLAA